MSSPDAPLDLDRAIKALYARFERYPRPSSLAYDGAFGREAPFDLAALLDRDLRGLDPGVLERYADLAANRVGGPPSSYTAPSSTLQPRQSTPAAPSAPVSQLAAPSPSVSSPARTSALARRQRTSVGCPVVARRSWSARSRHSASDFDPPFVLVRTEASALAGGGIDPPRR